LFLLTAHKNKAIMPICRCNKWLHTAKIELHHVTDDRKLLMLNVLFQLRWMLLRFSC